MTEQTSGHSLLNRLARLLLSLVFVKAVLGKLMGFGAVAGMIAAKGLPLAPLLMLAAQVLFKQQAAALAMPVDPELEALLPY